MTFKDRHNFIDVRGPTEEEFNSYAAIFYMKREDILALLDALKLASRQYPEHKLFLKLKRQFERARANDAPLPED